VPVGTEIHSTSGAHNSSPGQLTTIATWDDFPTLVVISVVARLAQPPRMQLDAHPPTGLTHLLDALHLARSTTSIIVQCPCGTTIRASVLPRPRMPSVAWGAHALAGERPVLLANRAFDNAAVIGCHRRRWTP
jgi:hypothetical protein